MEDIFLKRIYEPFDKNDGKRILIDRLWPRGVRKEDANLSMWAKAIAPSNELRKWFGHQPERFEQFKQRYIRELGTDPIKIKLLNELSQIAMEHKITALFERESPLLQRGDESEIKSGVSSDTLMN